MAEGIAAPVQGPTDGLVFSDSDGDENVAKAESQADFYDASLDDQDEAWAVKERQGRKSDAILTCPACFTTLSIDCQRHEKYVHQYRAMFVRNCRIVENERLTPAARFQVPRKRGNKRRAKAKTEASSGAATGEAEEIIEEVYKPVRCSICDTEVAVVDQDEIYHFFNVMPSYC